MTSIDRAIKLVAKGRAEFVDDSSIRMIDKPRAAAIPGSGEKRSRPAVRHSADPLDVVPFKPDAFTGQTYLHYPQAA